MTIAERWKRWLSHIGFIRLYRWRGRGFVLVPGEWTPRFDMHGRIYMLIAPADVPVAGHGEKP